jgi:drug/metabolite transporter (DMT)-like permease
MSGRLATATLTVLAMTAFAANSVLCRAALGAGAIDAASFALVRLGSGALTLAALHHGAGRATRPRRGLAQPLWLAVCAVAFSFAYRSLGAGTGALILIGCVQTTMLIAALVAGERFRVLEAAGLALALAGLASLVAPGLKAPAPRGAALMAAAGIAWGPTRSAAAARPTRWGRRSTTSCSPPGSRRW